MSDNTMPKRLYLTTGEHFESDYLDVQSPTDYTTEYIRADVCAERQNAVQSEVYAERMRADSLRKQLDAERKRIVDAIDAMVGMNPSFDVHLYTQAIKAAVWNSDDDPQEILKRELRRMPK